MNASKGLFYAGLAGSAVFEILNVYFIMPMPGSQRMASLDAAYFVHAYRWFFRIAFLLAVVAGSAGAFRIRRDRKSTRLNSSHLRLSRMPSSA